MDKNIAIVTDSNSGITQARAKELGVHVVPTPFFINGELYLEDITLSREEFYEKLGDMIQFLVPQYIEEGKQHLTIGIGCTGGRHRSVTISNLIYDDLVNKGYRVVKKHRDSMLR